MIDSSNARFFARRDHLCRSLSISISISTPKTGAECNLPARLFVKFIPFNEIIPQIFNFIYRSGDNRVDKSRRQRLKLPPSLSFVFFSPFLLFSFLCSPVEKERRNEESNYKDKVSRLIYRYKFRRKLLIVQYPVVRRKTRSNRFSFFLTKLLLILSALL